LQKGTADEKPNYKEFEVYFSDFENQIFLLVFTIFLKKYVY